MKAGDLPSPIRLSILPIEKNQFKEGTRKTMRLSLRLNLALIFGVTLVSLGLAVYQIETARHNMRRDLERRAVVLAESLGDSVAPLISTGATQNLEAVISGFQHREHVAGVAVYDDAGETLASTPNAPANPLRGISAGFFNLNGQAMHVIVFPVRISAPAPASLAIFQDAGYIDSQVSSMWSRALMGVVLQTALIVFITLLILHWSLSRPLKRLAQWLREVRTGSVVSAPELPEEVAFQPIQREMAWLASTLSEARAAAAEEARLRNAAESLWTPERLRAFVQAKLDGSSLFVVSNREPYEHFRRGGSIECSVPASGLVTALEPILRACNGTWVAQGSGDADHLTVDKHDRLRVPPEDPQYTLRRVWLTPEEEQGFYLGFANEGLWPLCHIAHTRPVFRMRDWEQYERVNRKFADVVLKEAEGEQNPVVLVQDYHFALAPRMIKEARPDARVIIFWHIPWPNPEAFGICPWQREILDGLLGADIIGFHIQSHCNNFLDTVDRVLESRLDREHFAVNRSGHLTFVRPFPISVNFSTDPEEKESLPGESAYIERGSLLRSLGVEASMFGIGVDRIDYTKGIPERFAALEVFFEKYPLFKRRFTFVQIGAPSRTSIRRYHDLMDEVRAEADRINKKFESGNWKPIVFLAEHHNHKQILPYYRMADLCLVSSLHDGMNLVAKEFISARSDEQGVLILSRFAGASIELPDSLLVNPYNAEEMADAIHRALGMSPEEKHARMARMRAYVAEHNIYRWAADLIAALAALRIETEHTPPVRGAIKVPGLKLISSRRAAAGASGGGEGTETNLAEVQVAGR
jgi:trehalose 6-phosphate synthase